MSWLRVCTKENKDITVLSEAECARLNLNGNSVSSQDVGCGLCLSLSPGPEGAGCGGFRVKEMTRKGKPRCFRPETTSGQCQVEWSHLKKEAGQKGFFRKLLHPYVFHFHKSFFHFTEKKKHTKVGSQGSPPTDVNTCPHSYLHAPS